MPLILSGNSGNTTLDSSNGLTFSDSSLQGAAASPFGLKNRIINGDMRIDQRNAGAATANTISGYTVDRWQVIQAGATGKVIVQQNAGSVTPPTGFSNYLGITSQSAYSVGSAEWFAIQHNIEGYNIADLDYGKATAKTCVLSFLVRSSLTGTFVGTFGNSASTRAYPFTYTISAANTWEQKTITVNGDTSGTWLTTNGTGLYLLLSLGMGSSFQTGTANNSWATSATISIPSGGTSVVGTNGATFYITGVQLEQNTSATPFERRLFNQELANCQRYYEKSYDIGAVPGSASTGGLVYSSGSNGGVTTSFLTDGKGFIVSKRAAPTMTIYDQSGNSGKVNREYFGVSTTANSTVVATSEGNHNFVVYSSGTASSMSISYHYVASTEL